MIPDITADALFQTSVSGVFIIPVTVLAVGVGLSFLVSCVSNTKSFLLARIDANEPKSIMVQDFVKAQVHAEEEEEETPSEVSPDRQLSLTVLDNPDTPPARIGAGADFDPVAGIFIVAGGMSDDTVSADIYIYSVDEKKWVEFQSVAPGFGFLYGYLGMLGESVVVFGGVGEDNCPRDTLQIYNFDQLTWEHLPLMCAGPAPCARFNGTASSLGAGRMVLFGGRDSLGRCLNDVWMFELRDFQGVWTQLYEGASSEDGENYTPEPREAHSAVVLGGKLMVFGGSNADGDILNTDGSLLEVFDLETRSWSLCQVRGKGPQVLCSGGSAHALPSVNKVLVISGEESEISCFNAVYVLDAAGIVAEDGNGIAEWALNSVQWCGDPAMPPDSRLFFAAALDEAEGDLYLFGGQQMCPDEGDAALQSSVALLDVSQVMGLLPVRSDGYASTEDDMECKDESAQGHSEVDDVHLGPLFHSLTQKDIERVACDIANETLEDFEHIKGEVDLAFASKYASEADLMAMRKQLLNETNENCRDYRDGLSSSCPLPKIKNYHGQNLANNMTQARNDTH